MTLLGKLKLVLNKVYGNTLCIEDDRKYDEYFCKECHQRFFEYQYNHKHQSCYQCFYAIEEVSAEADNGGYELPPQESVEL